MKYGRRCGGHFLRTWTMKVKRNKPLGIPRGFFHCNCSPNGLSHHCGRSPRFGRHRNRRASCPRWSNSENHAYRILATTPVSISRIRSPPMPSRCPFCHSQMPSTAVICPNCTRDTRDLASVFGSPPTPQDRLRRTQTHVRGLGYELFAKLIVIAPLAVLAGLPLLLVIIACGGIIGLWMLASSGETHHE